MKFGLRLVVSGIAGLCAGALFISQSFETPPEGMQPTPMWKGFVALGLGIVLIGYGIRTLVSDMQANPEENSPADETP